MKWNLDLSRGGNLRPFANDLSAIHSSACSDALLFEIVFAKYYAKYVLPPEKEKKKKQFPLSRDRELMNWSKQKTNKIKPSFSSLLT